MRLYPNPSHLEFVDPVVTGGARAAQTEHSGPKLHHNHARRGAAAAARRRGLPRPGRGRRDAQPAVARRLLDRRHDPPDHRQPGRLHHRSRRRTARPPTPATWRRASTARSSTSTPTTSRPASRATRLAMAYRERFGPRRRHRPDRLPPLRPQRDRRARLHAAEDGRPDQGAPAGLGDLRRAARRGGRRHQRRRRGRGAAGGSTELQGTLKGLRAKMEAGDYEDPSSTALGTGELDRTKSPEVDTAVSEKRLRTLNEELLRVPDSFTIHRKLRKPLLARLEKLDAGEIEYGHAEALAFASLLTEGTPHPPHRPGHRARHLLAPPPGAARREHGPALRADPEPLRRAGADGASQQPALGGRLPRVRVRLLGRLAGVADPLGGAVRRLRQLGAGDHRPVHRRRRVEVGPDDAADPAAPPRLRGRRPRALERADRALHPARLGGQHPPRQPDHRGPVLPPAAPPGADRQAAAAGRLHARRACCACRAAASSLAGADRPARSSSSSTTRAAPSASARRSTASSSAAARSSTTSTATTAASRRPTSPSPGSSCSTPSRATRSAS